MKKDANSKKATILMAPYVMTLVICAIALLSGLIIYVHYLLLPPTLIKQYGSFRVAVENEITILHYHIIFVSLLSMEIVLLFCLGWECFSVCCIHEDCLKFKCLGRRTVIMPFSDICTIGIDYGMLEGSKQFWIYFGVVPFPRKYIHNIIRLKPSKKLMRIQFSQDVFDKLVKNTPLPISRELEKAYSVIRTYKAYDE